MDDIVKKSFGSFSRKLLPDLKILITGGAGYIGSHTG